MSNFTFLTCIGFFHTHFFSFLWQKKLFFVQRITRTFKETKKIHQFLNEEWNSKEREREKWDNFVNFRKWKYDNQLNWKESCKKKKAKRVFLGLLGRRGFWRIVSVLFFPVIVKERDREKETRSRKTRRIRIEKRFNIYLEICHQLEKIPFYLYDSYTQLEVHNGCTCCQWVWFCFRIIHYLDDNYFLNPIVENQSSFQKISFLN